MTHDIFFLCPPEQRKSKILKQQRNEIFEYFSSTVVQIFDQFCAVQNLYSVTMNMVCSSQDVIWKRFLFTIGFFLSILYIQLYIRYIHFQIYMQYIQLYSTEAAVARFILLGICFCYLMSLVNSLELVLSVPITSYSSWIKCLSFDGLLLLQEICENEPISQK